MIAANRPIQRPSQAKLLVVEAGGQFRHVRRGAFVEELRAGDLLVANDAATLPGSLHGTHARTGAAIEVRLAGRRSLAAEEVADFSAVVFGAGDFHLRTEDRPLPPELVPGDRLELGPLSAAVTATLGHVRLISLHFSGSPDAIWAGIARHGRPIQYAHIQTPLVLWDVWTTIASPPVAFEPPSAGFALDWQTLAGLRVRGVRFATITHAAGISSTGDPELDTRLPFDEPYEVPPLTAKAIADTRARGGRIVAVGTTVVRALEHAAMRDGVVRGGGGVANQRIGPHSPLRIVDVVLTGVHEPGSSHYELLRAFTDKDTLDRADAELNARDYHLHEFGDSVLIEYSRGAHHTAASDG